MSSDSAFGRTQTSNASASGEDRYSITPSGLGYLDAGPRSDVAVVLLHSLGADHRLWAGQVPELSRFWRVIAPDSRGHGRSRAVGAPSVDTWTADLAEVLEHAGVASVSLVGVSLGGIQAIAFAAAYSAVVRALVVADSFVELDPAVAEAKVNQLSGQAEREGMDALAASYVEDTLSASASTQAAGDLRAAIAGMSVNDYSASTSACFGVRIADRLAQVSAPTLVLWGALDHKTPRVLAERIASGIAGAQLVDMPAAGHLSNVDNPERFTELTVEFLRRRTDVPQGRTKGSI